jgi:2-polyprenyl-3-methyl-5-hydroxy-6-metoxy-1,4-benzoquinol methylase
MISNCPVCGGYEFDDVLFIDAVAIHQFIRRDIEPTARDFHPLNIVQCEVCSHLFNHDFEPELGAHMYGDTPLSNILVNVSMATSLKEIAAQIGSDVYANKKVIEIGAGTGHLARIIAQEADEVCVFEPCLGLNAKMLPEKNIKLWNKNFSIQAVSETADFIISRQVIEHLDDPRQIILDIVASLTKDGLAYLEVPRAEYITNNAAVGDFHLAHVQYFSEENFLSLCHQCGLDLVRSFELKNGHDIGFLLARRTDASIMSVVKSPPFPNLRKKLSQRIDECRSVCKNISGEVSLYGATRNGQAILGLIGDLKSVHAAYDDNEEYEGHALYNQNQVVPVKIPSKADLSFVSHIIITSYLHHLVIAEKLRLLGFGGCILTASPEGCPENKFEMEGLFGSIRH